MNDRAVTALEVREQAADWLARRMIGPWEASDQAELEAWLAQSPAHEIEFLRMETGWGRTERLTALRKPGKLQSRPAKSHSLLFRGAAVLAVSAILGAGAFFLTTQQGNPEIYSTRVGGQKLITLADGSRIELNTNTVLRTNFSRSRREVTLLRGEAYFQVQHDAGRPFVVLAANHRVTDLGTKFLVRNEKDGVQVSLLEGKAELQSANDGIQQHSVILLPGDIAVASAHALNVSRKPEKELHDELGWRRGVIVLSHMTLGDAAAEFNRYNTTKIIIADEEARKRVIGATLPAHDVAAFADVAREIFGLHIEKRANEIVVTR